MDCVVSGNCVQGLLLYIEHIKQLTSCLPGRLFDPGDCPARWRASALICRQRARDRRKGLLPALVSEHRKQKRQRTPLLLNVLIVPCVVLLSDSQIIHCVCYSRARCCRWVSSTVVRLHETGANLQRQLCFLNPEVFGLLAHVIPPSLLTGHEADSLPPNRHQMNAARPPSFLFQDAQSFGT
jgi:hypothetical protein